MNLKERYFLKIHEKSPLGPQASLDLFDASIDGDLYNDVGIQIMHVNVGETTCTPYGENGALKSFFLTFVDTVDVTQVPPAFMQFISDFMNLDLVNLTLSGLSNVNAKVGPFGSIALSNIPLDVGTAFLGMGGLKDAQIVTVSLSNSTSNQIITNVEMLIYNPSIVTVPVGDMSVDMYVSLCSPKYMK